MPFEKGQVSGRPVGAENKNRATLREAISKATEGQLPDFLRTLEELREEWSDFRPPQCYYYLKEMEINLVKTMAKCDILGLSEKFKIYQTELLS